MTRRRFEVRRLPAAMLPLLLLGVPSGSVSAQPSDTAEVERLYVSGQERYEQKDYVGAVEAWTQILELLPETPENRGTRENVVINIVETDVRAYDELLGDDGQRDPAHLERAAALLDRYEAALREAYGPTEVWSQSERLRAEIDSRLNPSEREVVHPCLSPCLNVVPCLTPHRPREGCGSKHSAAAFVLLGALGLGVRRRRDAVAKLEGSLPADVVARLRAALDRDDPE